MRKASSPGYSGRRTGNQHDRRLNMTAREADRINSMINALRKISGRGRPAKYVRGYQQINDAIDNLINALEVADR